MNKKPKYNNDLQNIQEIIQTSRARAFKSLNKIHIDMCWKLGEYIHNKILSGKWGKSTVERVSKDLQIKFAGMKGLSSSNLWRMKAFFEAYEGHPILAQAVREIPWAHNVVILEKVKTLEERAFYIEIDSKNHWNRAILSEKIRNDLYSNTRHAQSNFHTTLSPELALEASLELKDEIDFSWVELEEPIIERKLQDALVANIIKLLAEMGKDYCFMGREFRLAVGDKESSIDLLFYHRKLKSIIAVELKAREFNPKDVGQMQYYLSILDKEIRYKHENPSIGIIICRDKNKTEVEYTLRNSNSPIGVSTFKYVELPRRISQYLPSQEQLEDRIFLPIEKMKNKLHKKRQITTLVDTISKETTKKFKDYVKKQGLDYNSLTEEQVYELIKTHK